MSVRLLAAAGFLILGLAGCGGSSSSTTASSSTAGSTAGASTPVSRAKTAPGKRAATVRSPKRTRPATTPSTVATAPPPTPAGTPSPPDGLRATTGYGSYDLCASGCSGAVPASLRRPLHLPNGSDANCPASAAGGPVTQLGGARLATTSFIGSQWSGARVQWTAGAAYGGPVLIRGRQLGGSGAVGFGEGHVPVDELQLRASGMNAPPPPAGGRSWLTFTRVRGPGCYAYQVDGTSFSSVIVFKAG